MTHGNGMVAKAGPAYAIAGDFCRIFAEDMNQLYLLSYLLTGDSAQAEECFAAGLQDCLGATRVFQDWTRSWARRAIVRSAIRMMRPAPDTRHPAGTKQASAGTFVTEPLLVAVAKLGIFERFVFVMSVLERFSDQDCKTLLGCSRRDVVWARARALRQIGKTAVSSVRDATVALGDLVGREDRLSESA